MKERASESTAELFLLTAACSGVLAVMLGAFGAHGLKSLLDGDRLSTYQTGVRTIFRSRVSY